MTMLIIVIAVLLLARILYLTHKRLAYSLKYQLGDRVRFVYGLTDDYVEDGIIWKVHRYWLMQPAYEIYHKIGCFSGHNHYVSESNIIELLERTDKVPQNPFIPKKQ